METTNYKLTEATAQRRLDEWQQADVGDLAREIALARQMLEVAVQNNQVAHARDLMTTIANLNKSHRMEQIRLSEYLHKSMFRTLAVQIGELFAEGFADVPGYEDRIATIIDKAEAVIVAKRNPQIENASDG